MYGFSCVCPGNHVLSPGESIGKGLTPEAAKDLGLPEGIAVAASLIDAHAGGLGTQSHICYSWKQECIELILAIFCIACFVSSNLL